MKNNVKLFVAFFEVLVSVKLYHYQVTSGFRHEKCDWMFDKFLKHTDRFLETLQGHVGRISVANHLDLHVTSLTDDNVQKYLKEFGLFLERVVPDMINNQPDLLNIRDDLLADINQFIYLMTFL